MQSYSSLKIGNIEVSHFQNMISHRRLTKNVSFLRKYFRYCNKKLQEYTLSVVEPQYIKIGKVVFFFFKNCNFKVVSPLTRCWLAEPGDDVTPPSSTPIGWYRYGVTCEATLTWRWLAGDCAIPHKPSIARQMVVGCHRRNICGHAGFWKGWTETTRFTCNAIAQQFAMHFIFIIA